MKKMQQSHGIFPPADRYQDPVALFTEKINGVPENFAQHKE